MTWQPEPDQKPDGPGGDSGLGAPGDGASAARPGGQWRRRGRQTAFGVLLTAGLAGLAVSAVGIAHQLLPRHFTVAQDRAIVTWEVQRRWRAVPAGTIFPASVPYHLSAALLNSTSGLALDAKLLGISPGTSCAQVASGMALRVLRTHGCSDALRATYVDASGSLVATVAVVVLPSVTAAGKAVMQLSGSGSGHPPLVRALPIARTAASHFGAGQRQLSYATAAESYVIMATAGFADGRTRRVHLAADGYLDSELYSLASGLADNAKSVLGGPPATPACPGVPGC